MIMTLTGSEYQWKGKNTARRRIPELEQVNSDHCVCTSYRRLQVQSVIHNTYEALLREHAVKIQN